VIDGGCEWLTVLRLVTPRGKGIGPAAGYYAGIRHARGVLIASMEADRQNDPGDIPAMRRLMFEHEADMVQGDRSANRRDNFIRRASSWVGRSFRRIVLGDTIRDSACAMRLLRREVALAIPFHLKGMQRFAAWYARMIGYKVIEAPVNHRPRTAGRAKFGVWNRALPSFIDLLAMRWMRSRWREVKVQAEARVNRRLESPLATRVDCEMQIVVPRGAAVEERRA